MFENYDEMLKLLNALTYDNYENNLDNVINKINTEFNCQMKRDDFKDLIEEFEGIKYEKDLHNSLWDMKMNNKSGIDYHNNMANCELRLNEHVNKAKSEAKKICMKNCILYYNGAIKKSDVEKIVKAKDEYGYEYDGTYGSEELRFLFNLYMENTNLKNENTKLEDDNTKLMIENTNLKNENKTLQTQNTLLTTNVNSLVSEISKLNELVNSLSAKTATLEATLKEALKQVAATVKETPKQMLESLKIFFTKDNKNEISANTTTYSDSNKTL